MIINYCDNQDYLKPLSESKLKNILKFINET